MKRKYWGILILLICGAILLFTTTNDLSVEPVTSKNMPEGVYAEILPRVELLAGVLSQTSWIDMRGPNGEGNKYYRNLKDFFSNYKNHRAIQLAEVLTTKGFTYDAPPNFILSLGELPNLERSGEYSEYLISRAGSEKILEEFRLALIDLARESNFEAFFQGHRDELDGYLNSTMKDFNSQKVISWMEDFYGWGGSEFHLVLAPAMFPGGGYGATIKHADGREIIFQVVRDQGEYNTTPKFPNGYSLERLTLHEWGHAFVNPSVEEHKVLIDKLSLSKLYKPVKKTMLNQAYGNEITFFNEQILRAVTAVAVRELYGESMFTEALKREEDRGFYLTSFTVEQLAYYQKNRDKFKTFKDFIPYLFEQYNKNTEVLLSQVKK